MTTDQAAPYLAIAVAAFPFGRHPLNGKLQFKNEDLGYWLLNNHNVLYFHVGMHIIKVI